MSEYIRNTRELNFAELNPNLVAALRAHAEKYSLGELTAAATCCETTATKQKKGLFAGKPEVLVTTVLLTSHWLIWVTQKNNEAPNVLSARLSDIQVQDYEKSDMHKLMPDTGLNISGLRTDAVELGSVFIGLGTEPAAQNFRIKLKEARAKA